MHIIDDYRSGHNAEFTHAILKLGHLLVIICVAVLVLLSGKTGRHIDKLSEPPPKVLSESVMAVKIWSVIALVALLLTAIFSITAANSNEQQIHTLLRERRYLFTLCAVHLLLLGFLIVPIVLQGPYIRSTHECIKSFDWSGCNALERSWRLQIVISIMLVITGLLGLRSAIRRVGVRSRATARYENRVIERMTYQTRTTKPFTMTVSIDGLSTVALPEPVYKMSPNKLVFSKTSNLRRYEGKPAADIYVSRPTKSSADYLQTILGQYGLLAVIVSELRCEEIRSLLVVSQGIRAAMLRAMPVHLALRKSLCMKHKQPDLMAGAHGSSSLVGSGPPRLGHNPSTKPVYKRCMGCGIMETCKTCSALIQRRLTPETIHHLHACRPTCDRCYKNEFCFCPRAKPGNHGFMYPDICRWHLDKPGHTKRVPIDLDSPTGPFRNPPTTEIYPVPSYKDIHAWDLHSPEVTVCSTCLTKPEEDLLTSIKADSGFKLAQTILVVEEKTSGGYIFSRVRLECFTCRLPIQKGALVWWVCEWCKRECTAVGFHERS